MVTLVEEKFMNFGVNWKSLGNEKGPPKPEFLNVPNSG